MAKTRIDDAIGMAAVREWGAAYDEGGATAAKAVARAVRATAVRYTLQALVDRAPGSTLEVRVPPFGAVQCVEGPGHTRGTPPNVVEMDAETWLALATGRADWAEERGAARVRASGTRADVSGFLPVVRG